MLKVDEARRDKNGQVWFLKPRIFRDSPIESLLVRDKVTKQLEEKAKVSRPGWQRISSVSDVELEGSPGQALGAEQGDSCCAGSVK